MCPLSTSMTSLHHFLMLLTRVVMFACGMLFKVSWMIPHLCQSCGFLDVFCPPQASLVPQFLYWVWIRGLRWPVHCFDSIIIKDSCCYPSGMRCSVVLHKQEVVFYCCSHWNHMWLQDLCHITICIELAWYKDQIGFPGCWCLPTPSHYHLGMALWFTRHSSLMASPFQASLVFDRLKFAMKI